MQTGAITSYIDVAQLALYAFFLFFAGLVFYLRREDKREGYPLDSDRSDHVAVQGFPAIPSPKTYLLNDGRTIQTPRADTNHQIGGRTVAFFPGAPMEPTTDPLLSNMGPASYANRIDEPDNTYFEHTPRIQPMRLRPDLSVAREDTDPRGMRVVGADNMVAGEVVDVWVDVTELFVRYLEMRLAPELGNRTVLIPMMMLDLQTRRRRVKVEHILGEQFARVPGLKNPDQVTLLEEDMITAYYAGGDIYATPARSEPFV